MVGPNPHRLHSFGELDAIMGRCWVVCRSCRRYATVPANALKDRDTRETTFSCSVCGGAGQLVIDDPHKAGRLGRAFSARTRTSVARCAGVACNMSGTGQAEGRGKAPWHTRVVHAPSTNANLTVLDAPPREGSTLAAMTRSFQDAPAGGLTLEQALERWRDPQLWAKNVEAARNKPRQGHFSDPSFWRLRREASSASRAVVADFKRKLREGHLVALGRGESFDAPLKAISQEAWQGATYSLARGTVTTQDGRTHYAVRIYDREAYDRLIANQKEANLADPLVPLQVRSTAEGTPIGVAEYHHAARDKLDAYVDALARWQEKGKPTTTKVDKFRMHTAFLRDSTRIDDDKSYVEIEDETWQALKTAEAALRPSLNRRLLNGECGLQGFREDTEEQSRIPVEVLATLKIELSRGIATTAGGRTYHNLVVYERDDYERFALEKQAATPASGTSPASLQAPSKQRAAKDALSTQVHDELLALRAAGKVNGTKGNQAAIIREICERLGIGKDRIGTVRQYVMQGWPSELRQRREKAGKPRR